MVTMQAVLSQALQLQRIEDNPGILPVKEGQASISLYNWHVIKTLDLNLVHKNLDYNIGKYYEIASYMKDKLDMYILDGSLVDAELQTQYIMNITIERYNQLIPNIRIKRGLINPAGSLIKAITGNLDNNDAVRYDNLINSLRSQQDVILNKVTLVSEIVDTFVNITNSTRNNFIVLEKTIKEIEDILNKTQFQRSKNLVLNTYNMLTHNFQILLTRLDEVETAVSFSRVNVLHQSILDTTELFNILKDIEVIDRLPFPVNIENLVNIEHCIDIKAYVKGKQITFIMSVPTVQLDVYNYYTLHPFPMYNPHLDLSFLITPKHSHILAKGSKVVSLSQPCREIDEGKFLCYENSVSPEEENTCIKDLMTFSTKITSCLPLPVNASDIKIKSIQPDSWIIFAGFPTFLTEYCDNDMSQHDIMGTYIITLNNACEVKIGTTTLRKRRLQTGEVIFRSSPAIHLPSIITPKDTILRKTVSLNEIDLENLQFLSHALKDNSEVINSERQFVNLHSVSIGTIIVYLILLFVLIIVIYRYRNILWRRFVQNRQSREKPSNDDFALMEGGVMHSQPLPRTVMVN